MLDRGPRPSRLHPDVVGIRAIGWYLGDQVPIASLPALAADPAVLSGYEARGFRFFTRSPVDEADMAVRSCRETFRRSGLSPADIDAVVIGWAEHRWFPDMQERLANRVVRELGFHNIHLFGLAFAGCTTFAALLRMGRNLLVAEGCRNVLVVEVNRCKPDDSDRAIPPDISIYSDGAASCIVTSEAPEFALRSVVHLHNANPNHLVIGSPAAVAHRIVMSTSIFNRALRHAQVRREQINQYFAPNHGPQLIKPYVRRLGLAADRVFTANTARIAHPWSADAPINLYTHCHEQPPSAGDLYAVFAWAEGSFGALVLERTEHPLPLEAPDFLCPGAVA